MMILVVLAALAAVSRSAVVPATCQAGVTPSTPLSLEEITGTWYLVISAYNQEEHHTSDQKMTFAWIDISVKEENIGMTNGVAYPGNILIQRRENATVTVRDHSLDIFHPSINTTMTVRRASEDCVTVTLRFEEPGEGLQAGLLYCRSLSGKDADVEAFQQHSHCQNHTFVVLRRSDFDYSSKCDSVKHTVDPLNLQTISGKWTMVGKASKTAEPREKEEDLWVDFVVDGKDLTVHQGRSLLEWSTSTKPEVSDSALIFTTGNTTNTASFYPTCEACLLMKMADKSGDIILYFFTRSGEVKDSEMEQFKLDARCLSLPDLYEVPHVQEEKAPEDPKTSEEAGKKSAEDV